MSSIGAPFDGVTIDRLAVLCSAHFIQWKSLYRVNMLPIFTFYLAPFWIVSSGYIVFYTSIVNELTPRWFLFSLILPCVSKFRVCLHKTCVELSVSSSVFRIRMIATSHCIYFGAIIIEVLLTRCSCHCFNAN